MKDSAPRIYFDHNASTPLHPDVREAMVEAMSELANPSSIHWEGRRARQRVEKARGEVAAAVGVSADRVVFTSSGTEACCLGVVGLYRRQVKRGRPGRIWADPMVHPAVLDAISGLVDGGAEVSWGAVEQGGVLAVDSLAEADGVALIVASHVNHELGNVAPIGDLLVLGRAQGAAVFVDAVQALGKLSLASSQGADALAVSAHKIYGPTGVGALVLGPEVDIEPIWPSGHQERGRRPGTENVVGICGFGRACRRLDEQSLLGGQASDLGEKLLSGLLELGARDHGAGARVPATVNVGFPGCPGDALVQALDLAGISASTGAACTSGSVRPSSVLLAAGLPPEQAGEAVRFSLGEGNTQAEVDRVLHVLPEFIARVRKHHAC